MTTIRSMLFGYLMFLIGLAFLNLLFLSPMVTSHGASTGTPQTTNFGGDFCQQLEDATGIIGSIIIEPACNAITGALADPVFGAVAVILLLIVAGALALISTLFISLNPSAVSTILLYAPLALVVLLINLSLFPLWENLPGGVGNAIFTIIAFFGLGLVFLNGASNLAGGTEG